MRFGSLFLSLALVGCAAGPIPLARYHEDGRAKPVVAVASVIDATSSELPWSLSEELTDSIVRRVSEKGVLFVSNPDGIALADNPFGSDLSWVKREFADQEFAVFLELVEHETVPANMSRKQAANLSPQEVSTNLNMGVRVRVIDLRGEEPRIVLQEMVRESYYTPKSLLRPNYAVSGWGTGEYSSTPLGIAHAQLVQEISLRLNDYILLAKSR